MVMICDVPTINETFVKDAETYAWRPVNQAITYLRYQGKYGIVFNDGNLWRYHRKLTLQVFKDFGMGELVHENYSDEEDKFMVNNIRL